MAQLSRTSARKPGSRRSVYFVLACILFPALVLLSFLPSEEKHALHTMGRFHSIGHILAFAVIAYIAARASRSPQVRAIFFLAAILAGFAIEAGEHLIYGSALEWSDILADSAGVLLGTILALLTAPTTDSLAATRPKSHLS